MDHFPARHVWLPEGTGKYDDQPVSTRCFEATWWYCAWNVSFRCDQLVTSALKSSHPPQLTPFFWVPRSGIQPIYDNHMISRGSLNPEHPATISHISLPSSSTLSTGLSWIPWLDGLWPQSSHIPVRLIPHSVPLNGLVSYPFGQIWTSWIHIPAELHVYLPTKTFGKIT